MITVTQRKLLFWRVRVCERIRVKLANTADELRALEEEAGVGLRGGGQQLVALVSNEHEH